MAPSWLLRTAPPALQKRWRDRGWWRDETIGQVLDRGLRIHGRQTLRIHSETRPWQGTFAEIRDRALRVAGALRERGVERGDPVAFQLPNWSEAAVTYYAASFLGAVVVPIVHFYGPKEVAYILRRTGVKAFVSAARFGTIDYLAGLERLGDALDAVDTVAVVGDGDLPSGSTPFVELEAGPPIEGPVPVDPASAALVAYTSGTTADPKGVIHSHRTIGAEVRQLGALHPPESPPPLVGAPVGHAIGMLGALLIPIDRGNPVNLIDVWNPGRVLDLMAEHGLAAGAGATFFLTSLLDHPDCGPEHLALMHWCGLGGAAVPAAVAERARDCGLSIVRMYGSTEHPSITGASHDEPEAKRLATDGHPLDGVEIRLVDNDGRDVPVGEPGEIWSRGPDCFAGYTDPALTDAMIDDEGWFHTEDIGVLDEDGYVRITDRKKDVIIRGGENVSAAEVEEVIAGMAGVAEVAVVAAPDARLGEHACAFVRTVGGDPRDAAVDLAAVRSAMAAAGLARQKWPEDLRIVDELPRTPSGKVKKAALRQQLRAEAP